MKRSRKRGNKIPLNFVHSGMGKRTRVVCSKYSLTLDPENSHRTEHDEDSMDMGDEVDHQDADTSQVPCNSSHTIRKERVAEKWANLRPRIRKRMVEKNCLQDDCLCCSCGQSASVKCFECGSLCFYCPGCCIKAHRTSLFSHQPLVWNANVSRQSRPASLAGSGFVQQNN